MKKNYTLYQMVIAILFVLISFSTKNANAEINLEKVFTITPHERISVSTNFSLAVHKEFIYLLNQYTNDITFWSGGILSKCDTLGGQYFQFITRFDADSLRLVPKAMKIDNDNNIVVYSELARYMPNDVSMGAQVLNTRKFDQQGNEIYNYSDTVIPARSWLSVFPINLDNDGNPVVIQTPKFSTDADTYLQTYTSDGLFLEEHLVDQRIATFDSTTETWTTEKFEIRGFTPGPDGGFYGYGERQMLSQTVEDTMSTYVIYIDKDYNKKWKYILYGGFLRDCYTTNSGDVVLTGEEGGSYIIKISQDGELIWKKFFGNEEYRLQPIEIIENQASEYFVIGAAYDSNKEDRDCYIAKFTKDGDMIWEERVEFPMDQRFVHIMEYAPDRYYIVEQTRARLIVHRFVDSKTDVKDIYSPTPALSLHPNPTSDFITISGMNDPTQKIDIYTLAGVNIMSAEGPRVDVSHLAPGFYFVRVGDRSLKFVKM